MPDVDCPSCYGRPRGECPFCRTVGSKRLLSRGVVLPALIVVACAVVGGNLPRFDPCAELRESVSVMPSGWAATDAMYRELATCER